MLRTIGLLGVTIFLLLLILPITAVLAAPADQNNAEKLLGPVQSVFEERVLFAPDGQVTSTEAISKTEYSPAGSITHIIWYKNHEVYREKINLYNSASRLTSTGTYLTNGTFQADTIYSYNDAGSLDQIKFLNPDGSIFITKLHHYNAKGLLTEQLRLDSDKNLLGRDDFSYSKNGKLTAILHYGSDNTLISKETYEYDKTGNINQECVYEGSEGKPPLKIIQYDDTGRRIAESNYTPSGVKTREFLCEYSPEGNKIKQIHYRGNGTKYAETHYNDHGLPKIYLKYLADGSSECSEEYQYQYDHAGNWIEQSITTCKDENPQQPVRPLELIRRTITYYE
ncbi:hypothetical protein SPFL3102_03190 [Sporomusaceae bacterium FL31]|nr:hypothetical protein SPFL3101_03842 [Sporomusaceae bacterium FL31]GCE35354.1 hypothetical protein SPFL3102_03190 [Sporomusaceae bacterium]